MITVGEAVLVVVDGRSIAWVPRRRELLELSDDAAHLVRAVRAGDPGAVPVTDVDSLLDQLLDLGVLIDTAAPAAVDALRPEPDGSDAPSPPARPDHAPGATELGPFAAVGWCFTITLDDDVLADELRRVLGALATTRPATSGYSITGSDGALELVRDDHRLDAGPTRAHVLATLLWDVNRQAVAATSEHLVLHAGAVAVGGHAVVLPAAMEAGKTTLVTGLVRAGCGYLSDELATVPDPADGNGDGLQVLPYPKAISLDPGSWPLFPEVEPDVDRRALSPSQWLLLADDVRAEATVTDPAPLGTIVLPRHQPGATTSIIRLDPVEALRALVECAFDFLERPAEVLPRLAIVAERVPVHRLVVGDGVTEAVELVLQAAHGDA